MKTELRTPQFAEKKSLPISVFDFYQKQEIIEFYEEDQNAMLQK